MPTENELLGIINGQRKYYREGILRIAELLTKDNLEDHARATLAIAENYGILNTQEAKVEQQKVDAREKVNVEKLILHELRNGEVPGGLLRVKVGKMKNERYYEALNRLLASGRVVKSGATNNLIYKRVS